MNCAECGKPAVGVSVDDVPLCNACLMADRRQRVEMISMLMGMVNHLEQESAFMYGFRPDPPVYITPSRKTALNIQGANIGVLNTGSVGRIHDVNVNANVTMNETEFVQELGKFLQSVKASADLSSEEKEDVIASTIKIAQQVENIKSGKQSDGIVRGCIASIRTICEPISQLAGAWAAVYEVIKLFFLGS